MKTNKVIILYALIITITISCTKNDTNRKDTIAITKVSYSGCFSVKSNSLGADSIGLIDSLYYVIDNSKLTLHINKVFACCSSLIDSSVITGNQLCIYLSNNDPLSMACNCICAYHYEYSLDNFSNQNIYIKVYLKEFFDNKYNLWKEIEFII